MWIEEILTPNPHNWSDLRMVQLIHSLPHPTALAPPSLLGVQSDTPTVCLLINGPGVDADEGLSHVETGLPTCGSRVPGT